MRWGDGLDKEGTMVRAKAIKSPKRYNLVSCLLYLIDLDVQLFGSRNFVCCCMALHQVQFKVSTKLCTMDTKVLYQLESQSQKCTPIDQSNVNETRAGREALEEHL